jgi:hypothetical protein
LGIWLDLSSSGLTWIAERVPTAFGSDAFVFR